jgi:hypothetical protein
MPRYLPLVTITQVPGLPARVARGSTANLTRIRRRDSVLGRKAVSQDFHTGHESGR